MQSGTRYLARFLALALLACLPLAPAYGRTVKQKKLAAASQFQTAERMREALGGKAQSRRTRQDYQRVLDAYRKVYYLAPNSNKADAAVLAVADLLDEQGRVFSDAKGFKDAIGQLEFLRREYPGSKLRAEALFTIAQIYRDDLDDTAQAKATFQEYLKHYPHSTMAAEARKTLDEIDAEASSVKLSKNRSRKTEEPDSKTKNVIAGEHDVNERSDASQETKSDRHRLPLLTSIRHWSTPDYTRVAIDLEQEVKYEAGRVPHPDRIFFDLHDAKLASDLVGKSFDVDDGFLHKIRVAQYKPNLARVVLDVDDVMEYSAFLLPNPYRLIIDIHGKHPAQQVAGKSKGETPVESAATKQKLPETPAVTANAPADSANPSTSGKPREDEQKNGAGRKTVPPGKLEQARVEIAANDTANVPLKSPEKLSSDKPSSEKPGETAAAESTKAEDKKIEKIEQADKATTKPTTAPTFHAVAPHTEAKKSRKSLDPVTRVATPTATGERSLIRALGLKIGKIVVDAGHGGHDTGTIGPNGLMEKDLVLDVALKLGKLLEDRLGAEVVYTREDDTFIPLETRTAIANKEQADLFISIHANSSSDASARGIETYYLNFTSSADALEVAARENAVSEKSIHELQDLVKKIALKEKIEESREFAVDVEKSLYGGLGTKNSGIKDRGVKKAPFIVLIGANMPSILSEISFVSNPSDEKKLKTNDYRQRIAESLYKGIARYINGLAGVKVASKMTAEKPGN
ncbi:MAG TPA: N-acetylmuramoyl-L-alanine amidase [Candidatus Angelobacter sp.]|jgi:N-acetylmuramoyl-L-alanine amidase|nr:N-acetylmuramoyl-L-alanine amidase [Candidatus Angelobacter sp.]